LAESTVGTGQNVITGHFGLASGVKGKETFLPLWALMLAAVWLDILFVPLLIAGVETIEDAPGTTGGYGNSIIHADYTHSLLGALLISALTGWLVLRWWGRRGAVVIGAVVFSHWVLDLLVHRADLPLLPGNVGDVRVGMGLWRVPWAAIAVELLILLVGVGLYWRAAKAAEQTTHRDGHRADLNAGLILLFGLVVLTLDVATS